MSQSSTTSLSVKQSEEQQLQPTFTEKQMKFKCFRDCQTSRLKKEKVDQIIRIKNPLMHKMSFEKYTWKNLKNDFPRVRTKIIPKADRLEIVCEGKQMKSVRKVLKMAVRLKLVSLRISHLGVEDHLIKSFSKQISEINVDFGIYS